MLLVLEPSFQKTMSASQSIAPLVPARAPRKPSSDLAWSLAQVSELFELPFNDLLFRAQEVHRRHFPEGDVELATLLSIKTGGCPEDCAYCPQAARYHTDVKATKLLDLDEVLEAARAAKAAGSNRFCMGAAWREPKDRDLDQVQAGIDRDHIAAGVQHRHRERQQALLRTRGKRSVEDVLGRLEAEAGTQGFEVLAHVRTAVRRPPLRRAAPRARRWRS